MHTNLNPSNPKPIGCTSHPQKVFAKYFFSKLNIVKRSIGGLLMAMTLLTFQINAKPLDEIGLDHNFALQHLLDTFQPESDLTYSQAEIEKILATAVGVLADKNGIDKRTSEIAFGLLVSFLDRSDFYTWDATEKRKSVIASEQGALIALVKSAAMSNDVTENVRANTNRLVSILALNQGDAMFDMDKYFSAFIHQPWSAEEKDFITAFASVYEASRTFWAEQPPTGETRRGRRPPLWVTILADSLGAGLGGAAGAAGGPVLAGLTGAALAAAASYIFSDKTP